MFQLWEESQTENSKLRIEMNTTKEELQSTRNQLDTAVQVKQIFSVYFIIPVYYFSINALPNLDYLCLREEKHFCGEKCYLGCKVLKIWQVRWILKLMSKSFLNNKFILIKGSSQKLSLIHI